MPSPSIRMFTLQPDIDNSVTAPVNFNIRRFIISKYAEKGLKFMEILLVDSLGVFITMFNDNRNPYQPIWL